MLKKTGDPHIPYRAYFVSSHFIFSVKCNLKLMTQSYECILPLSIIFTYTEDAGCAITTGIPVKFGTTHGRSRLEVGSAKCIDLYGSGLVSWPSLVIENY